MIHISKILFILVNLMLVPLALAESVVVIVNEANTQNISEADIKGIYNDNLVQWNDGSGIRSFDLPTRDPIREIFSQNVLGISARDSAREWANRRITNTAKNPPKTKREKLVVLYVMKDPHAIGYVSKSAIEGKTGIRVVLTIK